MPTTDPGPTPEEFAELIRRVADAASDLCSRWTDEQDGYFAEDGTNMASPMDRLLTETYPRNAISMSFDEFVAEVYAWADRVRGE
jgi:hypothetical protein